MLQTIKNFFEQKLSLEQPDEPEHKLKLATAALLIEMMQQDDQVHDDEIKAVREALQNNFALTHNETLQLCELAKQELDNAVDSHQFTRLIAKHYTQPEKIKIIENLWRVAFADSHLDPLEEHMVRHIAELIYVPHREFIRTKHKVKKIIK
jgi:uncharacterized tellurite resistance protein B-like protein